MTAMDQVSVESGDLGDATRGLERLFGLANAPGVFQREEILRSITRATIEVLGADSAVIMMLDDSLEYLQLAACEGVDAAKASRLATAVGENLAGLVAKNATPIRTDDIVTDDRSCLGNICVESGIRSGVLVPLICGERVVGVLSGLFGAPRSFSDRDEAVLRLLAHQAALLLGRSSSLSTSDQSGSSQTDDAVSRLGRENEAMRRLREARDRLVEAMLCGTGPSHVLTVAAEILQSDLTFINQFGTVLYGARVGTGDEGSPPQPFDISDDSPMKPSISRALEQLRDGSDEAVVSDADAGDLALRAVRAAGEVLGAVATRGSSNCDEFGRSVMGELTSILAAEMLRERSVAEAEARVHGSIVHSVLTTDGWGPDACARAALLGNDLTAPHCVIVLRNSAVDRATSSGSHALLISARRAASHAGLLTLIGDIDGTTTVLLGAGDRQLSRSAVDTFVRRLSTEINGDRSDHGLRIGISSIPADLSRGAESLDQARQAVSVCRLTSGSTVIYFDDANQLSALIDITKEDAVRRYVDRVIGELLSYDRRKQMDLTHTLETYLDCSGVVRHAAKALYLHPHSLRYRLRRIVEIQGTDLDDPMSRLAAHLALKLRQIVEAEV